MKDSKREQLKQAFDISWEVLTDAEEKASAIATQYATGDAETTMKDVDRAFADMKKPLKDIRKLAHKMRKKNEQPTAE